MLTRDEFESLTPWMRGYVVYQCGCREDQPWVPDETNPYPEGSVAAAEWNSGNMLAALDAQDGDD